MQVFYIAPEDFNKKALSKEESNHCIKVLRKNQGEIINLIDGLGNLYEAEISSASPKKCEFKIINTLPQKNSNPDLHIAIAPPKSMDRFEIFIEKSIELGIAEITPVISEHSERRKLNLDKLQKNLISTCKQSLTFHFPLINAPKKFKDIISQTDAEVKLIGHCEKGFERSPIGEIDKSKSTIVFIGPEGDFSKNEIDWAYQNGYTGIALNEKRLRTETAGISIVSLWNLQTK